MNTQAPQDLTTYIHEHLYPALYERLTDDDVLPEFRFKGSAALLRSTTTHKITGRDGKTAGQVYVYGNNPGRLIDHSDQDSGTDLISYIMHRDNVPLLDATNTLADMARVDRYQRQLTDDQRKEVEQDRRAAAVWEAAVNYCVQCIHSPDYKAEAALVGDYLLKRRAYTPLDVAFLQIGYLPSQEALYSHLRTIGHTDEDLALIKLHPKAGTSHRITIPLRSKRGAVIGLALRHWHADVPAGEQKYLYNTGLKKSGQLFGLGAKAIDGRVVLVEGQLDAGIPVSRGYSWASVAAIGGKVISKAQVQHLIDAGAREVFVCLDNEPATQADVLKTIEALAGIEALADRVYIVTLPDGIKDADELITKREDGLAQFTERVKKAQAYYLYLADRRIEAYNEETATHGHTDVATNNLTDDVVRIATRLHTPTRREELYNLYTHLLADTGVHVNAEAFKEAAERIRYNDDLAQQSRELGEALKQSESYRKDGKVPEALDHLNDKLRKIKTRNKRVEFERLDAIDRSEAAILSRIREQPDNIKTGYHVVVDGVKVDIELAAGQLNFIAAPTGHGKTLFLLNTALNVLRMYPEKEVLFFAFEQSADDVLLHTLNTYVDATLNGYGFGNRNTILQYYKGNNYIKEDARPLFEQRKAEFFANVVPRLKLINVEYSADEIIEYVEHVRKRTKDVLVCIDYIQKLRSDRKGNVDGRATELQFICEDLNAAALPARTGLPFLLAAQFNRDVHLPTDMHPTRMADASNIEKIASEIIGLFNCSKRLIVAKDTDQAKKKRDDDTYRRYGLPGGHLGDPKTAAVIIEVLKSRRMATGHSALLKTNPESGRIYADQYYTGGENNFEALVTETAKKGGVKFVNGKK